MRKKSTEGQKPHKRLRFKPNRDFNRLKSQGLVTTPTPDDGRGIPADAAVSISKAVVAEVAVAGAALLVAKKCGPQHFADLPSQAYGGKGGETITTIAAAKRAGFQEALPAFYGGEQVMLRGKLFVRNFKIALSKTAWGQEGFNVKPGQQPHATLSHKVGNGAKRVTYDVFRDDQIERKKVVRVIPPVAHPVDRDHILAAVFVVNRSAKRHRDGATSSYMSGQHGTARRMKEEKKLLYDLKDRGIAFACLQGWLSPQQIHGGLVLYRGSGYCLHSTLQPVGWQPETLDSAPLFVEAQPQGKNEMRVKDAVATLSQLPQVSNKQFLVVSVPALVRFSARLSERQNDAENDHKSDNYYECDDKEWTDGGDGEW